MPTRAEIEEGREEIRRAFEQLRLRIQPEDTPLVLAKRAARDYVKKSGVEVKRTREPWWHPTEKLYWVPVDTEKHTLLVKVRSKDWKVVDCSVGDVWQESSGMGVTGN